MPRRLGINTLLKPVELQPAFVLAVASVAGAFPWVWNLMPSHPDKVFRFLLYTSLSSLFFAYLCGWIVLAFKGSKIAKAAILLPVWVLSLWDWTALVLVDGSLSATTVALALETNANETAGFFSQYFTPVMIGWVGLMAAFSLMICLCGVFCQFHLKPIGALKKKIALAAVLMVLGFGIYELVLVLPLLWAESEIELTCRLDDPGVDPKIKLKYQVENGDIFTKSLVAAAILKSQVGDASKWQDANIQAMCSPATCGVDSLDVVVIIGESFARRMSSIYGCEFPTNPRLQTLADSGSIIAFDNIVSCANFTSLSLKNTLSLNDMSQSQPWYSQPYFPLIFKKAGFKVSFFDNQSVGYGNSAADLAQGSVIWNRFITQNCYDQANDRTYGFDGDFLSHCHPKDAPLRLIFYHLMGQHFPAGDRYPRESWCQKWDHADIVDHSRPWLNRKQRQDIADFYNATLYNDSIVSRILNQYSRRRAVAIYFSDHGTSLYETPLTDMRGEKVPADADSVSWRKNNFDVPFLIWTSTTYRASFPYIVASLRSSSHRHGRLDNLGQILFQIAFISSPYFKPEKSLISNSYQYHSP